MRWVIGATTVTLISAGAFVDDASIFFATDEAPAGTAAPGKITLALNCLLLESGGRRILVDTGFGDKPGDADDVEFVHGARRLCAELRGYAAPEEIDLVINTHLHADHSGGNTVAVGGVAQPAFPRAEYLIQQGEWAEASRLTGWQRTLYRPDNVVPLQEAGRVAWLHGNTEVTDEVRCIVAPGHTSWHQYVQVSDGQQTLLFLGDVAPTRRHLEKPALRSGVDLDPVASARTRRRICRQAMEQHSIVILTHEAAPGRIVSAESAEEEFHFVPLAKCITT